MTNSTESNAAGVVSKAVNDAYDAGSGVLREMSGNSYGSFGRHHPLAPTKNQPSKASANEQSVPINDSAEPKKTSVGHQSPKDGDTLHKVRFDAPESRPPSPPASASAQLGDASTSTLPSTSTSSANTPENTQLAVIDPVKCVYSLGKELGVGTYSVVNEIRHLETDQWFAGKIINKSLMRGREHLVKNEIAVLKRVSRGHPNILTLVDFFETTDSLFLVTELAKGGELFDRIYSRGSFQESDAAQLMRQITSGVAHLHAHGIVHRDLKPENLLFKTNSPASKLLICDFGLSRIVEGDNLRMLTTTVGTPSYMAPEIFTKQGHGKPVDIWALGVIAYLLLSGFTPFDRDSPTEEREAIERGEFQFTPAKFWAHITADAQDFIRQCLQTDPNLRPTAASLLASSFLTRKYRGQSDIPEHMVDSSAATSSRGTPAELNGRAMNGAYSMPPEHEKRPPVFSAKWG